MVLGGAQIGSYRSVATEELGYETCFTEQVYCEFRSPYDPSESLDPYTNNPHSSLSNYH